MHANSLMYHIKGWTHYTNNRRYLDMTGIIYTHIFFADVLLAFGLIKFDQIVTYINQVPQFDFDSETYF